MQVHVEAKTLPLPIGLHIHETGVTGRTKPQLRTSCFVTHVSFC